MLFFSFKGNKVAYFNLVRKHNNKKKKNRGATAVEFALIATPFMFLIFALIEIMMVFIVQTTLEAAVTEEARKIRTGQAQNTTTPITKAQFKANVCTRLYGFADCTTRLFVMVQSFPAAPGAAITKPWDDGTLTPGSADDEPYDASAPGDLVIVRGYYVWPLLTPGIASGLSNYSDGTYGAHNRMLVGTAAFRNEPFL